MTITLYEKKEFKGKSLVINRNYRALADTTLRKNPSSLIMTGGDDAIFLFKKMDWNGGIMYSFIAQNIPIGYFGEPEDIGHLVAFLASPVARYITGAVIPVDGGMHFFAH